VKVGMFVADAATIHISIQSLHIDHPSSSFDQTVAGLAIGEVKDMIECSRQSRTRAPVFRALIRVWLHLTFPSMVTERQRLSVMPLFKRS
jgi:hypothetical protein